MILHGPDYAEELALITLSRAQRGERLDVQPVRAYIADQEKERQAMQATKIEIGKTYMVRTGREHGVAPVQITAHLTRKDSQGTVNSFEGNIVGKNVRITFEAKAVIDGADAYLEAQKAKAAAEAKRKADYEAAEAKRNRAAELLSKIIGVPYYKGYRWQAPKGSISHDGQGLKIDIAAFDQIIEKLR